MKDFFNDLILTDLQKKKHLYKQNKVLKVLKSNKVKSFMDIGSGDGQFIELLVKDKNIKKIIGIEKNLKLHNISKKNLAAFVNNGKVFLVNSSVFKLSKKFFQSNSVDAVTMIEVIEHIDKKMIPKLNQIIFEEIRPSFAVFTTPNASFKLDKKTLKSFDHKFEWNEKECLKWGNSISKKYGYAFTRSLIINKLFKRGSHLCVFKLKEK